MKLPSSDVLQVQTPRDDTQPVTWQSVLIGLFTLAIANFVQAESKKESVSTRIGSLSPFWCFTKTLNVCCEFLWFLSARDNEGSRFNPGIVLRHFLSSSHNAEDLGDGLSFFVQHLFTPILVVLQFVKILGLGGIPLTKACAVCYFVTYLSDESSLWYAFLSNTQSYTSMVETSLSEESSNKLVKFRKETQDIFEAIAICLNFMYWIYVLGASLPPTDLLTCHMDNGISTCEVDLFRNFTTFMTAVASLVWLVPFFSVVGSPVLLILNAMTLVPTLIEMLVCGIVLGGILVAIFGSRAIDRVQSALFLCILVSVTMCLALSLEILVFKGVPYGFFEHLSRQWIDVFAYMARSVHLKIYSIANAFWIFLPVFWLERKVARRILKLPAIRSRLVTENLGHWSSATSFVLFINSIVSFLVYYVVMYDSKGTNKPSWTEYLG